ncbi:uncharacterized protein EDB91DRAFT_1155304 [Suillus paluster]|uniref:uncharacterized protein n=1 Tax=Suillus paluster TaxID=48578 RepID=UPI001B87E5ED|nr:uncharacterized protein EDB91DRAFT_1155304 [Suillus paluster]KAG1731065.1 hypothetical protein EDB91DRAFT_1155304 [Suillus paluster]
MLTLTFQISNVLFFLASLVLLYLPTHWNLEHSLFSFFINRSSSIFFNFGVLRRFCLFYPSRLSTTLVLLPRLHSVFGRFCFYALH